MYLLDTDIISAVGPGRRERAADLSDWLERASDRLYIAVITVAEVRSGIAKKAREGATRKAAALKTWWDSVEYLYAPRILSFDMPAAIVAGDLIDRMRGQGFDPGFADVAIAAIATVHGFTVVTRNRRHFAPMLGAIFDPFEAPSSRL